MFGNQSMCVYSVQILTALKEDVGGSCHSRGAIHTGPAINPEAEGMILGPVWIAPLEGVIISTIIQL